MLSITALVALISVPWYQLTIGFEWTHWLAFFLFAASNGLAITAGYHRLWAHNAYKAHPILRLLLALFGAASFQNSILVWSSQHRRHHRFVDNNDKDPYSANRGLWFSHIGWLLRKYPNGEDDFSNAKDLQRDKIVMWQHK
ncbi:MAG: fatty acid desaturase, partial [Pseudomonadales bacterium]